MPIPTFEEFLNENNETLKISDVEDEHISEDIDDISFGDEDEILEAYGMSLSYAYDSAKGLPEYKALIKLGFKDASTAKHVENGTFFFVTPLDQIGDKDVNPKWRKLKYAVRGGSKQIRVSQPQWYDSIMRYATPPVREGFENKLTYKAPHDNLENFKAAFVKVKEHYEKKKTQPVPSYMRK